MRTEEVARGDYCTMKKAAEPLPNSCVMSILNFQVRRQFISSSLGHGGIDINCVSLTIQQLTEDNMDEAVNGMERGRLSSLPISTSMSSTEAACRRSCRADRVLPMN
jgi:hypothetical protein